jgi:hypothetical protein
MFAFYLVLATSCPSFFKGATPLLSRHAYNTYIEKLILDLPTNDSDQSFNNQSKPKKLFSFI